MDQNDIIILRSLAGRYPIRFLGAVTGIGPSTINRFLNGGDSKISTVLTLYKVIFDGTIGEKFKAYKKDRSTKF